LFKTLQKISFTLPFETSFNPYNLFFPTSASYAFNYSFITPEILELLFL